MSGAYGDTLFTTEFGINPKLGAIKGDFLNVGSTYDAFVLAASSFHPGGANHAFVDGSVRFIKDSISTWQLNPTTGIPNSLVFNSSTAQYSVAQGASVGVYQALSTRTGGEVIGADSY